MTPATLYVIDDEESIRAGLRMELGTRFDVSTFADAETALAAITRDRPDLVLLDIGLPRMDGIEALGHIMRQAPETLVIMITAYEDIATVVSAMKQGAHDYVVKPLHLDALTVTINNALETLTLRTQVKQLQAERLADECPCIIGQSDALQDVMELVATVARSPDTPILIRGETGTGKELLASTVHHNSPLAPGPFVALNCAAIPQDLLESELFGYERGAFSGARSAGKKGLVEQAQGGTLFLDEVGDLSSAAQAKLLRFLEDGSFYRVGGTTPIRAQARIVSATNQDLEALIASDRFRRDLFFRLSVVSVSVPSLNERREDIIPLADHFLSLYRTKFNRPRIALSAEAQRELQQHAWTGNVRELKNLIERAVLVTKTDRITPIDLGLLAPSAQAAPLDNEPLLPALPQSGVDFEELLSRIERHYYTQALTQAAGNESGAARLLRLNHHTFRYRKKKLGL